MVIDRQSFTGNCCLVNSNGSPVSLGVRDIIGTMKICPFLGPVAMTVSRHFVSILLIISRVPFAIPGARFRMTMTGIPTLSARRCRGIPAGLNEFKNSVGYATAEPSSLTESIDL